MDFETFNLEPRLSRDGTVSAIARGWRLAIPAGTRTRYRLAQLDDHLKIERKDYPWRSPVTLRLQARVSSAGLPGTWGFGLWNDPYGFSFGPGKGFLRLPALPNAAWFFYSSANNYLSFRDDLPGNGFLAQAFSSPVYHRLLPVAALALPFARSEARRMFGDIITEDSALALPGSLPESVTDWHTYRMSWQTDRLSFWSDEILVLATEVIPRGPLGVVIWIDNQFAAFTPQGTLRWGMEANPEPAWLEIRELDIRADTPVTT